MKAQEIRRCDLGLVDVLYEAMTMRLCRSVVLRCRVVDKAEETPKRMVDCFTL